MKKRKIIIISSLLVLLLVGGLFASINIFKTENKNIQNVDNTPTQDEVKEDFKNEEIVIPEETKQEVTDNVSKNDVIDFKDEEKQNNDSSSKNKVDTSSKNDVDKSSSYQQSNDVDTSVPTPTPDPVPKEEVKEQNSSSETKENNSYVGVPDPNNFNYSMHHGIIEYNDKQSCINDSIDIGFKDTVDITNSYCLEVYGSNNNILGYYLYIKCSSGNCDKYKN